MTHLSPPSILFRGRTDHFINQVRESSARRGESEMRDVPGEFEVQGRVKGRTGFSHRLWVSRYPEKDSAGNAECEEWEGKMRRRTTRIRSMPDIINSLCSSEAVRRSR